MRLTKDLGKRLTKLSQKVKDRATDVIDRLIKNPKEKFDSQDKRVYPVYRLLNS